VQNNNLGLGLFCCILKQRINSYKHLYHVLIRNYNPKQVKRNFPQNRISLTNPLPMIILSILLLILVFFGYEIVQEA